MHLHHFSQFSTTCQSNWELKYLKNHPVFLFLSIYVNSSHIFIFHVQKITLKNKNSSQNQFAFGTPTFFEVLFWAEMLNWLEQWRASRRDGWATVLPPALPANTTWWHETQVTVVQLLPILGDVLVDELVAPHLPFPPTDGGLSPLGSSEDEKVDEKDEI